MQQMKTSNGLAPLVEGYPKLGAYMGLYPESAIIRKFGSLNGQNLLYLQAELTHLELRLREVQAGDSKAQDGQRSMYARDWYWLDASATEENSEQWQIMMGIRGKLKEYSKLVDVMTSSVVSTDKVKMIRFYNKRPCQRYRSPTNTISVICVSGFRSQNWATWHFLEKIGIHGP